MANLAAAARARVQTDWPSATTVARGRRFIILENPSNPANRRLIASCGSAMHIRDSDVEIDTAWVAGDQSPYFWQMEIADYYAYVGENSDIDFNTGIPVMYVHPSTGSYIGLGFDDLGWTNDNNDVQSISGPLNIPGSLSGDTVTWAGAYGAGLNMSVKADSNRLQKLLTINSLAELGVPEQYILDGGNPRLRLNVRIEFSSSLRIFVDGVEWTKKNNTSVIAAGRVEFRAADGITLLWFFESGYATDPNRPLPADWDTNPSASADFSRQANADITVSVRGGDFLVEVTIPWSFLEESTYPVYIDPSISDTVSGSTHDVWWSQTDSDLSGGGLSDSIIYIYSGNAAQQRHGGFYFDIDTTIKGATINTATIAAAWVYLSDIDAIIYCADVDSPGVFSSGETTASIAANLTSASSAWLDTNWSDDEASADFASAVEEVTDRAGWTGGMRVYCYGEGPPSDEGGPVAYDFSSSDAAYIDIDYTAGGGTVTGVAALSGSGAASIIGMVTEIAAAALSGTGSLSAIGLVETNGVVSMSGVGGLTAIGSTTATVTGVANLSGTGSLSAVASPTAVGVAALSGAGALSAIGSAVANAVAAFSGVGALTAAATAAQFAAANLSGTGSLTAVGTISGTVTGVANLSGAGALSAVGANEVVAAATLSGNGALSAVASASSSSAATLSGNGSLSAVGAVIATAAASLSGEGALTAVPSLDVQAASTLSGTGALSAVASVTQVAAATLSGEGSLTAVGTISGEVTGKVTLSGTGALTAIASVTVPAVAALSGTGSLTAVGSISGTVTGVAALSGSGALTAAGKVTVFSVVTASGVGSLSAQASVTQVAAAVLSGVGALTAVGSVEGAVSGVAALSGEGALSVIPAVTVVARASFSGQGSLQSSGELLIFAIVALSGLGSLSAVGQVPGGFERALFKGMYRGMYRRLQNVNQ